MGPLSTQRLACSRHASVPRDQHTTRVYVSYIGHDHMFIVDLLMLTYDFYIPSDRFDYCHTIPSHIAASHTWGLLHCSIVSNKPLESIDS